MQKLVRLILSFALVLGFGQSAYAEFVSIYSTASTAVPVPSSATPIVLSGSFQNLYAPTGVSGCSIGVTSLKSLCSQPGYGALQLQFPGYSFPPNANEVKVYIPAGTMRFTMVASMPQGTIAAAALRMDTAPTRVAELSNAEYSAAQSTMKYDTIFSRLLAGSEVIQTHDGGGTFTIAWGYANGSNSQYVMPTGRWLYIRFINFADLYQVMASTLVNLTAYQTGYSSIQWDANGDPVDTASGGGTTTTPTTPTTPTTTPLTGITLSSPSLASTSTNNKVILSSTPVGATLPTTCKAFDSGTTTPSSYIAGLDSAGAFSTAGGFQVAGGADSLLKKLNITKTVVTINCGNDAKGNAITADFTIQLPLNVAQAVDANGILTLSFPFTTKTPTSPVDLYVLAYVPDIIVKSFSNVKDDLYVYQVSGEVWKPILFAEPEAKQTGVLGDGRTIFINTGLPKTLLQDLKVYIYVAYLPTGSKDSSKLEFIGDTTVAPPTKLPSSLPLWR